MQRAWWWTVVSVIAPRTTRRASPPTNRSHPTPTVPASTPPRLLLLSHDDRWTRAVQAAAAQLGAAVFDAVRSAPEAVRRLLGGPQHYSHLVMQPGLAGPLMPDLVGLTVGEAGTGTNLVLLGEREGGPPDATVVPSPSLDALLTALAIPPRTGQPDVTALLDREMRHALASGQVEARYQPIVRLADRRPMGLEVLARMNHPQRGTLPPGAFVPQIEEAGLSGELTRAVADTALRGLPAAFLAEHDLYVTLNLPLDLMQAPDALVQMEAQRQEAGLAPGRILVELTESRPVLDVGKLSDAVVRWREAGYALAIDDAGPEIENLRALFDLPFTAVKLDRGIVGRSAGNPHARTYLARAVQLAHGSGKMVIAEGIETQADWDRMAKLGVDQVQGFLIARPLPATVVPLWLEMWGQAGQAG